MDSFPHDIVLYFLEYLDYHAKFECLCSCKSWHRNLMKRFVRKVRLAEHKHTNMQMAMINTHLASHSFIKASICLYINFQSDKLPAILDSLNYTLDGLEIYGIDTHRGCLLELEECFAKITGCKALCLSFRKHQPVQASVYIPFLPRVQSLSILYSKLIDSSITNYVGNLHHLYLESCSITDVSMLGFIQYLELRRCNNLVDITALNDNDHVVIEKCSKITDYSRSFMNSRKIEITLSRQSLFHRVRVFDLSRWTKVVDLQLRGYYWEESISFISNQLPTSVRRCILQESFVSSINFRVTSDHVLNEITLSYDDSITNLEGYGLEKLAIVELDDLLSLQTLQGLGRGRNRKIVISSCNNITDFSPLNHLSIVEIQYCTGFTDPLQVRFVRDLTIRLVPISTISFISDDILRNPYKHIHSLTILSANLLKRLDGLEEIPNLCFDDAGYHLLKVFLEEGKILRNQRIVFEMPGWSGKQLELFSFQHSFLTYHYDDYIDKPKKRSWIRKSSPTKGNSTTAI